MLVTVIRTRSRIECCIYIYWELANSDPAFNVSCHCARQGLFSRWQSLHSRRCAMAHRAFQLLHVSNRPTFLKSLGISEEWSINHTHVENAWAALALGPIYIDPSPLLSSEQHRPKPLLWLCSFVFKLRFLCDLILHSPNYHNNKLTELLKINFGYNLSRMFKPICLIKNCTRISYI